MGGVPADCVLRPYRPEDCVILAHLFHKTVHKINARDYSPAQLDAWSSGSVDLDAWNHSFLAHDTWIALLCGEIVGFADMDTSGYLDRLYVHHRFQHRGIATALCDQLEQRSVAKVFTTHASITAVPFFQTRGYRMVHAQTVTRHGIALQNFIMEKQRISPR